MRACLTIVIITCTIVNGFSYSKRDLLQNHIRGEQLASAILTDKSWIGYPLYNDREAWDKLFAVNRQDIIERGSKYLDYQWKVVRATDYLDYRRNGDRGVMEVPFNANLEAINSLFFAEMAEGQGRFIDQLVNGIYHTCEMTSWSNSAHLVVQKGGGPLPNHNDDIIDLVSADVGAMLSWINYFLKEEFDKMSPLISERIVYEIDKKIITPYLTENRFWWMAINATPNTMVNNWNVWCNSNVLQCLLLSETNAERQIDGIQKTMISVDKFINYMKSDGACEEGPSYWGHAAGKLYDYLQILYDATQGKIDLFGEPLIKNLGEYIANSYIGNGWVVNFADASAKAGEDPLLIYRYGKSVSSEIMTSFATTLYRTADKELFYGRDTYRKLCDLPSGREIEKEVVEYSPSQQSWYSETGFCYIRQGEWFFAGKSGHNAESHNHNDVGSFILYHNSHPVFIDAGTGTYTSKTFSSDRYSLWFTRSDYHNLPIVNGFTQKAGRDFRSGESGFGKQKNIFSVDIAPAYPAEAKIRNWKRDYQLTDKGLTIVDDYIFNKKPEQPNEIVFMLYGGVSEDKEGVLTINVNGKTFYLYYDKSVFTPDIEIMVMDDQRFINVWGEKITRVRLKSHSTQLKGKYKFKICV